MLRGLNGRKLASHSEERGQCAPSLPTPRGHAPSGPTVRSDALPELYPRFGMVRHVYLRQFIRFFFAFLSKMGYSVSATWRLLDGRSKGIDCRV
jgi:hypothetical protein